jgi:hypothetical protein
MRRSIFGWGVAALVIVLLGIALLWPTAYSIVTGRPLEVDCNTLTAETCDRAIDLWASDGWGPVTAFVVDNARDPESTCADVTITRWGLDFLSETFDVLCQ